MTIFTIINMLIFEYAYDDFMILSYDKVWSQISSHKMYLFKLWLRHSLRVLCLAGSENVLFRWTSSVDRRSLYKQQVFSNCDWLLFLFTIITYDRLWWSYDEFTTKLWRFYDRKFVIRFFENRAPELQLLRQSVATLCSLLGRRIVAASWLSKLLSVGWGCFVLSLRK